MCCWCPEGVKNRAAPESRGSKPGFPRRKSGNLWVNTETNPDLCPKKSTPKLAPTGNPPEESGRVPFKFYFDDYTCDELNHIGGIFMGDKVHAGRNMGFPVLGLA